MSSKSGSKFSAMLSKLKEYYDNEFSLEPALSVIGSTEFEKREFGFQVVRDNKIKFIRNISFSSTNKLMNYIRTNTPVAIYVGAIYSEGPNYFEQKTIQQLDWIKREFIIDIDLTEYDSVRPCSCKGKNMLCDMCWELIIVSIQWIHLTLVDDFGIKDIKWVFSGRRGVHAWILDRSMSYLDEGQRSAIIDYMTFFKGDGGSANFSPTAKFNRNYQNRTNDVIINSFFRNATISQIEFLGFSKQRAKYILDQRDNLGVNSNFLNNFVFNTDKLKISLPLQNYPTREKIIQNIMLQWSPRIDTAVSIDLRRILRLPGSIHGESGKRVKFLDFEEIEFFNPLNEESIYGAI